MTDFTPGEPTKPRSDRFRLMAERLDHNADAPFGGACVIIPPNGGGEPIEILMLDVQGNVAQFWATIGTRIQMVLKELDEKKAVQSTFGYR